MLNNGALAVSGPLLVLLVSVVGIGVLIANVLTLLLLMAVRFAAADEFLWSGGSLGHAPSPPHTRVPMAPGAS